MAKRFEDARKVLLHLNRCNWLYLAVTISNVVRDLYHWMSYREREKINSINYYNMLLLLFFILIQFDTNYKNAQEKFPMS